MSLISRRVRLVVCSLASARRRVWASRPCPVSGRGHAAGPWLVVQEWSSCCPPRLVISARDIPSPSLDGRRSPQTPPSGFCPIRPRSIRQTRDAFVRLRESCRQSSMLRLFWPGLRSSAFSPSHTVRTLRSAGPTLPCGATVFSCTHMRCRCAGMVTTGGRRPKRCHVAAAENLRWTRPLPNTPIRAGQDGQGDRQRN